MIFQEIRPTPPLPYPYRQRGRFLYLTLCGWKPTLFRLDHDRQGVSDHGDDRYSGSRSATSLSRTGTKIMVAKLDYARSVNDRALAAVKKALLSHIEGESENFKAQDDLLSRFQSLKASQTALTKAAGSPVAQSTDIPDHVGSALEDDISKMLREPSATTTILQARPKPAGEQERPAIAS
ncbi:hypothetical protein EVC30_036 [Rhizobium phage RHph_Y1_11]|nr:hypothetical protein EVC30_036 [Rhizobium phage RHph_Y1_11]